MKSKIPEGYELVKALERLLKMKKKGKKNCSATEKLFRPGTKGSLDTSKNIA